MIRKALGLFAFGGVLVAIAACSSDDEAKAKYPAVDSFCAAKAAEECKAVAAGCTVTDDACKDARTTACKAGAAQATSQGRTYRPENAENCVAKTTAVYADRTIVPEKEEAFIEACERVFVGSKKRNDACSKEFDCESSLVCDLDKGVCAQKVEKKVNDPCNNPGDICGSALFCKPSNNLKVCTAKGKLGESCRLPGQEPEQPCVDDARCNGSFCVALVGAGQPCDTNDECSTRFCNADRKCQARAYASETGTCKDFGGN